MRTTDSFFDIVQGEYGIIWDGNNLACLKCGGREISEEGLRGC